MDGGPSRYGRREPPRRSLWPPACDGVRPVHLSTVHRRTMSPVCPIVLRTWLHAALTWPKGLCARSFMGEKPFRSSMTWCARAQAWSAPTQTAKIAGQKCASGACPLDPAHWLSTADIAASRTAIKLDAQRAPPAPIWPARAPTAGYVQARVDNVRCHRDVKNASPRPRPICPLYARCASHDVKAAIVHRKRRSCLIHCALRRDGAFWAVPGCGERV